MTALLTYELDEVFVTKANLASWTVGEAEGGGGPEAVGPCPACGDVTRWEITLEVVSGALAESRRLRRAEDGLTQRIQCLCRKPHPDRPAPIEGGCGRFWLVTVTRDGEGWHCTPVATGDFCLPSRPSRRRRRKTSSA